jgi:hypothetical protein
VDARIGSGTLGRQSGISADARVSQPRETSGLNRDVPTRPNRPGRRGGCPGDGPQDPHDPAFPFALPLLILALAPLVVLGLAGLVIAFPMFCRCGSAAWPSAPDGAGPRHRWRTITAARLTQ